MRYQFKPKNTSIMYGCVLCLYVTLQISIASPCSADITDLNSAIIAVDSLHISENPTWLKLLHFEKGSERSSVLTDSFFLSPAGRHDPESELKASIEAYYKSALPITDSHPVCRFPARYFWLSKQIPLPVYNLSSQCLGLKKSGILQNIRSASIMMVSSYYGNAASAFGHSLLKFNLHDIPDTPVQHHVSINYGVPVPENENAVRYAYKGLTGGYEGRFSASPSYHHDLIYTRQENRDMWEYRLALTQHQLTLLILHAWEIVEKEYKYLFLNKNCGFRMAELIDLITDEDMLGKGGPYYPPVRLFHQLEKANENRIESGDHILVSSITFHPSAIRTLSHELSNLSEDQIALLNKVLSMGIPSVDSLISQESITAQSRILNSLLAYHHYLDMAEVPNVSPKRLADRNILLFERLKRPADSARKFAIPEVPPPTQGFKPTAASVGFGSVKGMFSTLLFSFSPYRQESIGHNSMEGGEMVVADLEAGISQFNNLRIQKFDLFRMLNLNLTPVRIKEMSNKSWRLRLGVDRESKPNGNLRGIASGGLGRAKKFSQNLIGYSFLNMELRTATPFSRIRFDLGALVTSKRLNISALTGFVLDNFTGKIYFDYGLKSSFRLSRQKSVEISHQADSDITKATFSSYF
jgi:hypothetical protein